MRSWQERNPGWDVRFLDATTVKRYAPIRDFIDLESRSVTAASLSDIVRILLLHEFGGVWVDATLFCNRPLDDWLFELMEEGFFAFRALDPNRPISSWFLSAAPGNKLVSAWCRETVAFWRAHEAATDYFWFHSLFKGICETDPAARDAWSRVPRRGAEAPHAFQIEGRMFEPAEAGHQIIDWSATVFKLTHRLPAGDVAPGSLLEFLLRPYLVEERSIESASLAKSPDVFASLKVSTENIGDHIQIIAGQRLLSRLGIKPTYDIDRDHEMAEAPQLAGETGPVGLLLNGWFKMNQGDWPPHPKLLPVIFGFHARPNFCPALLSEESLEFYRKHQPIGCRDVATSDLLRARGIEVFTSNCLTLSFPRRIDDPSTQTDVFVVSRDRRIEEHLPATIGPYTFVCHYSGSNDFACNMRLAEQALETYRRRAKLVITTMLHCALPAIAMNIPVIVFYPINHAIGHAQDLERFSTLAHMLRIHTFDDMAGIDWNPAPIEISATKLRMLDDFYRQTETWNMAPATPLGPIAPSAVLPPPEFR